MKILKTMWKIFLTILSIYLCSGFLFVSVIAGGLIPILWIAIPTAIIFMYLDLLLFVLSLSIIWTIKKRKK